MFRAISMSYRMLKILQVISKVLFQIKGSIEFMIIYIIIYTNFESLFLDPRHLIIVKVRYTGHSLINKLKFINV